jgi:hypothetical protein
VRKWLAVLAVITFFGYSMEGAAKSLKKFKLAPSQIKNLAPNHGRCAATDMITVQGHKVGYMYRDNPQAKDDSGWAFFDGHEQPSYLDDPKNIGIYDVNTIANYDPDIIPFLDMPVGSTFERDPKSGKLSKTDSAVPADETK